MLIPQLHNKVILLAEDDRSSILLINTILQPTGVEVITVMNGLEAVATLERDPKINLVLMDVQMPEMDGIEATIKIREKNKTIPIIAQTAFATTEDKARCQRVGFTAFIAKPIDIRLLYDTLWVYLNDK